MFARHHSSLIKLFIGSLSLVLAACNEDQVSHKTPYHQPVVDARASHILHKNGYQFKDLNKNGALDAYEDWRLPTQDRVGDLVTQMNLEEKIGMMLIDTLNAEFGGNMPDKAVQYIRDEKMTRFIFRNPIVVKPNPHDGNPWSGAQITPYQAAQFLNLLQETAESTRLGIPLLFKSNARNHIDPDARFGINSVAGAFSAWPKEAGLAATRDMSLIADFSRTMRSEWNAIGLRGMYGYMADLSTEPRWFRVHETFSEDADLVSDIVHTLITNLQGESISSDSVVLTMKHFPGGGPQEGGGDPHYAFGKRQVYPANNFDYHVKPFRAAIDAGVAAVMPYYGVPVDQSYQPNDVGMAFSKGIVTGLLRDDLGFQGVVNSDTGIITERAWGLEDKTIEERLVLAIDAGTDVLSGFHENEQIRQLVTSGLLPESRVDESVRRLLTVQFQLGLFENPYVDADRAAYLVGNADFKRRALEAQRKSVVLLKNDNGLLPLKSTEEDAPLKVFTMGMNPEALSKETDLEVVQGDYDQSAGEQLATVPSDVDAAIIRVTVNNQGADKALIFGGSNEEDLDKLSFSEMAVANSWQVTPSLEDIHTIMEQAGADKTVLAIYFRQPYVLDNESQLINAGGLLATFGVSDDALLDVIRGRFNPSGQLPFALANKQEAIVKQAPDAPGYAEEDTLYPFGWGMQY